MGKKHVQQPYDVCLSFAGEDRNYVQEVAARLQHSGVRVFYDDYEKARLWGKDLYEHLDYVYRNAARFCVIFISKHYVRKLWTAHERKSAQARAIRNKREYILPARFDDTELPGLLNTIGYIDLRGLAPKKLAVLIYKKIGPSSSLIDVQRRSDFVPSHPDKLFKRMRARSKSYRQALRDAAFQLKWSWVKLDKDERKLIANFLMLGCPHDLPKNLHIDIDLLRRASGFTPAQIRKMLKGVRSVGFRIDFQRWATQEKSSEELIIMEWVSSAPETNTELERQGTSCTEVATVIVSLINQHYCSDHVVAALVMANFSCISTATSVPDVH